MTFGFARPPQEPPPESDGSSARGGRLLELAEWASAGIPLLRAPREVVADLYARHLPGTGTVIVAVLDPQERVIASASFGEPAMAPDGWAYRNALLAQLRRIIPHDLRLRVPARTAVLLHSREGEPRWTEADGAWMWGLRDACTLHGLRCGAYIALTRDRWQVVGEGRGGRLPRAPSPTKRKVGSDAARSGPRHEASDGDGALDVTTGASAPEGIVPSGAAPPQVPRSEGQSVAQGLPVGPGPVTPQRVPAVRAATPGEQPRNVRGTPRRSGGGATETRRRTVVR